MRFRRVVEQKIIDEIFTIKNMTVIVITHRLEILKKCNKIILIDNGKIKMDGDYDSLIRSNLYFPLNYQYLNHSNLVFA